MRDPIDQLESFDMPGTTTPLPAAEVRRRGDRIRRRNTVLATAGSVAAVVLIATPFALAATHTTSSTPRPAPASQPPGGWVTTIPAGFDLGALPSGATYSFAVHKNADGTVIDDIRLCGSPAFSTQSAADPATDAWGAVHGEPGTESQAGRTLAVYPDAKAAQDALDGLRQGITGCPDQPNGTGSPLVNEVTDTPVPAVDDGFVWTNQAKDGALLHDLTATEVARVGNALLLANAFSSAGGPQASGLLDKVVSDSAPVVAQMCTFSVQGCGDGSSASPAPQSGGLSGTIPDDFPLEKGLPTAASRPGFGLDGPAHDLDVAVYSVQDSLRACGRAPAGLPRPTDTLYAGYRTISAGQLRQLMTFASADEAQAYAVAVAQAFADCPEETDAQGVRSIYDSSEEPRYGDFAASAVMRREVGGKPAAGTRLVQVVRVGQAVLLTVLNDEGTTVPDDVASGQLTATYLQQSQSVIDAMGA